MLESEIQRKIIKRLEAEDWLVIKIIQCNKNGFTDLMALKNGRAVFIEVKRPGEKPTELQLYRHEEIRKHGFEVILTSGLISLK